MGKIKGHLVTLQKIENKTIMISLIREFHIEVGLTHVKKNYFNFLERYMMLTQKFFKCPTITKNNIINCGLQHSYNLR